MRTRVIPTGQDQCKKYDMNTWLVSDVELLHKKGVTDTRDGVYGSGGSGDLSITVVPPGSPLHFSTIFL